MGKFQDAMNNFGQTVDLPEEFKSAITSAYEDDFSSYDAKVNDLESKLANKDETINQLNTDYSAQINSLKSANYDLLRAVPKDAQTNGSDKNEDDDLSDQITIADLFGSKS
jgi:hypothetical protein